MRSRQCRAVRSPISSGCWSCKLKAKKKRSCLSHIQFLARAESRPNMWVSFYRLCARVFVYFLTPPPLHSLSRRNMGDIWRTDNRWGESRWIIWSSVSQSKVNGTLHTIGSNSQKKSSTTEVFVRNRLPKPCFVLFDDWRVLGCLSPHPVPSFFHPDSLNRWRSSWWLWPMKMASICLTQRRSMLRESEYIRCHRSAGSMAN